MPMWGVATHFNWSEGREHAAATAEDMTHSVALIVVEGLQLSAVQSSVENALGAVQLRLHDVGRPAGAAGAGHLSRYENMDAVSMKLISALQKVKRNQLRTSIRSSASLQPVVDRR